MTNEFPNPKSKKYNLGERSSNFGKNIIVLAQSIPETVITRPLINQLIRAGTSVGANYMEADSASSKKDFVHKIGLCKKEAKETLHWLRMMNIAYPRQKDRFDQLAQEAHELSLIFASIFNKVKQK